MIQQPVELQAPSNAEVWSLYLSLLATGSMPQTLGELARAVLAKWGTQPAPVREPLTEREIELIDGMIEVQLNHAARCDAIANRVMAEKQKGWDMERVELLRKLKAARAIAAEARRDALEEAAQLCDSEASAWENNSDGQVYVQSLANAIRTLKETAK